jgi:hypothetical protein
VSDMEAESAGGDPCNGAQDLRISRLGAVPVVPLLPGAWPNCAPVATSGDAPPRRPRTSAQSETIRGQ